MDKPNWVKLKKISYEFWCELNELDAANLDENFILYLQWQELQNSNYCDTLIKQ